MNQDESQEKFFAHYATKLQLILAKSSWHEVSQLANDLRTSWENNAQVFLCGNGGSAANAIHLANDYLYGVAKKAKKGMRVHALPSNQAVISCLANDTNYAEIYSEQLRVHAQPGDLLIVFSGSGNSPNIVCVLEQAKKMGVKTYAILGFSGGKAKSLADVPIHFPIDDMQISEDLQTIVGHMIMQWLTLNPPKTQINDGSLYAETACYR